MRLDLVLTTEVGGRMATGEVATGEVATGDVVGLVGKNVDDFKSSCTACILSDER